MQKAGVIVEGMGVPVYGHTSLVARGKNDQYSKSSLSQDESIQYMRENDLFLPDAVICGVLMTIIPRELQEEDGLGAEDIYKCCAEEGIAGVLERVAGCFSLDCANTE